MPYIKLETNVAVTPTEHPQLLHKLSKRVAELLGKPERYVMVSLHDGKQMLFSGSDAPLAFIELKSLGLEEGSCAALSAGLCEFISQELGVESGRIYIEFVSPSRAMWGWDGGTF